MYTMAFFKEPRSGSAPWMGEILSARQVQKPSTAGPLIDHLAWRFPLLLFV